MRLSTGFVLLCLSTAASAEVYRWVDENNVVHFGDKPVAKDAVPAKLPPLQVISGGAASEATTPPPAAKAERAPAAAVAAAALGISITAPLPDTVMRSTDRSVAVSVSLQRPLPDGVGLVYFVDGNRKNGNPIQALSYVIPEVDRGSHLIEVAAVDGRGKELGRAAPVLIHLKPPGLN